MTDFSHLSSLRMETGKRSNENERGDYRGAGGADEKRENEGPPDDCL